MKNTDIRPGEVVPVDIRKEVYTEAIKTIERGKPIAHLSGFPLCLMLPCLLWDLSNFLENVHGEVGGWDSTDAPKMFPELNSKRLYSIGNIFTDTMKEDRDKQRIKVLTEMLADLQTL